MRRETVDVQRLIDCVRERRRRSVLPDMRGGDEDFHRLGERLADVEICLGPTADNGDLAARVSSSRRVAIYALETARDGLRSYHRQMIGALRNAGYITVVVADSADDRILPDRGEEVDLWLSHHANRSDFRTWSAALAHLAPGLAEAEHLLLLNDNLVGPMGDLQPVLRRLERNPAQICGLTETIDGERRLQADFMLASGDALTNGALARVLMMGLGSDQSRHPSEVPIDDVWAGDDRVAASVAYADIAEAWVSKVPDQVAWARSLHKRHGELGLAAHLPLAISRCYAEYLEEWLIDRADRVAAGEHFNPQHVFWDALIGPQFPFLNKELLQVNPLRVPTLIRLGEVCARFGDEASRAALRELIPDSKGFPRSYLRLSGALIDTATPVMA